MNLSDAKSRYPGAIAYRPGDNAALNAEILRLMRAGRKTMTCDSWENAVTEGLPIVGRIDIALDWNGRPALATRTCKVERIRFCDMDQTRIPPQGEFADLDDWRRGYEAHLTRRGSYHPEIELMVETFEMVEDFQSD